MSVLESKTQQRERQRQQAQLRRQRRATKKSNTGAGRPGVLHRADKQRSDQWDQLVHHMARLDSGQLEQVVSDMRNPEFDFDSLPPNWQALGRHLVEAAAAEALATSGSKFFNRWMPPEVPNDEDLANIPNWVERQVARCLGITTR